MTAPPWICLLKCASLRTHPAGPVVITLQSLRQMVKNFQPTPLTVPPTYGRGRVYPRDVGRVIGIVTRLEIRGTRRMQRELWGRVEWTEDPSPFLQHFVSACVDMSSVNRSTGAGIGAELIAAEVTSMPLLDLPPIGGA